MPDQHEQQLAPRDPRVDEISLQTPPEYRPALDQNGKLVGDEQGLVVKVPSGNFLSFEPRHERYMKIAEVVTTLASAFLVGCMDNDRGAMWHSNFS